MGTCLPMNELIAYYRDDYPVPGDDLGEESVADDAKRLAFEVEQLQAIVDAQAELIDWYETEHDRGTHDEESLPEDFLELEKAVVAAKAHTIAENR